MSDNPFGTYEINDDLMNQYLDEQESGSKASVWFKPEADTTYNIRVLPFGNHLESIPFVERRVHDLSYSVADESGGKRKMYVMVTCWDYLASKIKTFGKELAKAGKLTPADLELYKKHKCPVCSFGTFIRDTHEDKEMARKFNAQTKYLWNIVVRLTKKEQEAEKQQSILIWATSQKLWQTIINTYLEAKGEGVDVLHPDTGRDWILTSKGVGLQRRYELRLKTSLKGVPVGDVDNQPHDLVKAFSDSFVDYQKTIDALKTAYPALLQGYGYEIPGDTGEALPETINEDENEEDKIPF